jgi:hypothetical protein
MHIMHAVIIKCCRTIFSGTELLTLVILTSQRHIDASHTDNFYVVANMCTCSILSIGIRPSTDNVLCNKFICLTHCATFTRFLDHQQAYRRRGYGSHRRLPSPIWCYLCYISTLFIKTLGHLDLPVIVFNYSKRETVSNSFGSLLIPEHHGCPNVHIC